MEKKIVETSDDDMETSDNPELIPLKIIDEALKRRTRVSTTAVQIVRNDPETFELVAIEGSPSPPTLQLLKDSLADLVPFPENKKSSFISEDKKGSWRSENLSSISKSESKTESYFSIPSCTSSFDGSEPSLEALQKAEEAIADTDQNGPIGLVQLSALSKAIDKPIRITIEGTEEILKIGSKRPGEAVEAEYHKAASGQETGHWTLPGNKEPEDVDGKLNDCLFSVIGYQTDNLAPELREATAELMRKNGKSLAKRIKKIAELEKCDRVSFLVGGARYTGSSPQDAREVIDKSQRGRCDPQNLQGHPRGHASHPGASGETESAENYSHTGRKSAFLSREDQDAIGHLALKTAKARRAMEQLNNGSINEAVHVSPQDLEPGALPDCVWFSNGQRDSGERPFRDLVLVLRHHTGQRNNPDADVFVHTFYPRPQ